MSAGKRVRLMFSIVILTILTVFYPFVVYTSNPFISELRTIWIETAMETMTHQWLATAFFPEEMVTEVVQARKDLFDSQKDIESIWGKVEQTTVSKAEQAQTEKEKFYTLFEELDQESCEKFFEENPQYLENGYDEVNLDWCEKEAETGIVTTQGDAVRAINAEKGILIVEVRGDTVLGEYNGMLAIAKDPTRVELGLCRGMGSREGQRIADLVDYNDAILGINASGFVDNGEAAEGGTPYGYVKHDGEFIQGAFGHGYKIIGFDEEHRFLIGDTNTAEKMVDAIEFGPALIINGEKVDELGSVSSLQPRTAIGQTEDLTVLMLVINGRAQNDSTGCSAAVCRDILWRYGAVQASNLDGGSSSVMAYNGRVITYPSTSTNNPEGRRLPNAFIVK